MYITKVILKNIRCFEHLEIDFNSANGVRKWAVILGNNGMGKTSLLRSIAMGLNDETGVAALLEEELTGWWIRRDEKKGSICIEFTSDETSGKTRFVETLIEETAPDDFRVRQTTDPDPFPWDEIFVCGYGAMRGNYASETYLKYSSVNAVYTLFNYDASLQNPELTVRRIKDHVVEERIILAWLENILILPEDSIRLGKGGLTVSGPWGKDHPLGVLGDGYRVTIGWITDFLALAHLYDEEMFRRERFPSIVLLDAIEQHLHPFWQRHIIKRLRDQFPEVQFITTTHAPLCAAGTADLEDEEYRLILLRYREEEDMSTSPVECVYLPPLRGLRADQVLTSDAFGLPTSIHHKSAEKLERFKELFLKDSLKPPDQEEFKRLREELGTELPEAAETVEQQVLQRELRQTLEDVKSMLKIQGI